MTEAAASPVTTVMRALADPAQFGGQILRRPQIGQRHFRPRRGQRHRHHGHGQRREPQQQGVEGGGDAQEDADTDDRRPPRAISVQ